MPVNYKPNSNSGGLGKIAGIGINLATGNIPGATAASTNSPLGKMAGLYSSINSIGGSGKDPSQPPIPGSDPQIMDLNQNADYQAIGNMAGPYGVDALSRMQQRLPFMGGGGY